MTIDKGQVNTRERAISSDMNRQVELTNRAIVEGLSASVSGYARESGVLGDNAFLVTPQNGTMKSAIGPGLALFYDDSKVFPLSKMVWCESREIREVTHAAADAQARWDVIEMRPGELVSSTQARDQFDSLTGSFTVVNMVKEIKSYPEFQIRSGTPSATPGIPAGVPGWMPLAYVLVAGNAVAVDSTKVVFCRPLLSNTSIDREGWSSGGLNGVFAKDVKGGGVSFPGGSLSGTLVNTLQGRFGGNYHFNFRVSSSVAVKMTTMTWDSGTLPGMNTLAYFYAIPAPYPAGYDSMAGRELWTPDTTNLYGVNGGFYDAALQNGCIIVGSTKAPNLNHPSGAPTGSGTFAHEFFANAGNATSIASSWVYIGSGFYDNATNEIVAQFTRGSWVAPARKSGARFDTDLPIAAPITYNVRSGFAGAPMQLPISAIHVGMQACATLDAGDVMRVEIEDNWTGQGPNIADGAPQFVLRNDANGTSEVKHDWITDVADNGSIKITRAYVAGVNGACTLIARAYEDAVLSQR